MLVIDVSGSMHATDVKPSRLAAAQSAVRTFLEKVPHNVRVGLIAFAGDPQVAAPPTTDLDVVRQGLDSLSYYYSGYGGTAIGDAIAAAVDLVKPAKPGGAQTIAYTPIAATKSPVSILFLSDGHQTRGLLQPLEGAARAKAAGIPVYTIALGTPNGTLDRPGGGFGGPFSPGGGPARIPVPPDPATLRQIAQMTGGKFFDARSAKAVESAYSHLGSVVARMHSKREATNEFVALGGDPARRRRRVLGARRSPASLVGTRRARALGAGYATRRRRDTSRSRRPTTSPPPIETTSQAAIASIIRTIHCGMSTQRRRRPGRTTCRSARLACSVAGQSPPTRRQTAGRAPSGARAG